MIPIRIRVDLSTPVLMSGGFLTLDGIIAATNGGDDLPFVIDGGVARASAAMFVIDGNAGNSVDSMTMFRRLIPADLMEVPDRAELTGRKKKWRVNQNSDEYKSASTTFLMINACRAYWFAAVHDKDGIDRILAAFENIPGIGRKASLGWGEIDGKPEIDEIFQDCSWVFHGGPARPIPVDMWKRDVPPGAQIITTAARHPYWLSQRIPCVSPVRIIYKESQIMKASGA